MTTILFLENELRKYIYFSDNKTTCLLLVKTTTVLHV